MHETSNHLVTIVFPCLAYNTDSLLFDEQVIRSDNVCNIVEVACLRVVGKKPELTATHNGPTLICSRKHRLEFARKAKGWLTLSKAISGPLKKSDRAPCVKNYATKVVECLVNIGAFVASKMACDLLVLDPLERPLEPGHYMLIQLGETVVGTMQGLCLPCHTICSQLSTLDGIELVLLTQYL